MLMETIVCFVKSGNEKRLRKLLETRITFRKDLIHAIMPGYVNLQMDLELFSPIYLFNRRSMEKKFLRRFKKN